MRGPQKTFKVGGGEAKACRGLFIHNIASLIKESDIVNNQRILNRITKEGFVIKDNSKALKRVLNGNFALVTTGFEYLGEIIRLC